MALGRRFFMAGILLSACLFSTEHALFAQSVISGDISGTVTDPTGAVVPNATVTATNRATGRVSTTKTEATGYYHFAFLPPGSYQVDVKTAGFAETQKITDVAVGQTSVVDVQLEVAAAAQTVEVSEAATAVSTQTADLTTNVTTDQIQFLPNSGNDMTYVALVSPGTVMSTSMGYGNFSSFGLPGTANLFTLNGQNDNDMYLNLNNSGASNLMLGANELAEATVVNNGYSGQYGQLAGAQVNYLTKSGTNQFHGNAEWFWNGRALNANDFFNNLNGVDRPFANANQWAASVGGPIIKDKTFFFVDYEGLKNVLPTGVQAKIPSPQFEQATVQNLTSTGQTAAVNLYQKMFALYNGASGAASAVPVTGGGCGTYKGLPAGVPCALKFQATNGNRTSEYLWAARVTHHFTEKDEAYIRLWRDNGTQPTYTDPIAPIFNTFSPQPQMQGQIGETHTFGATAVNQFIFSGFYYSARFGPPDENAVLAAFPTVFRFSGGLFSNMGGASYNFPQGRNVQQFQVVDDFSKTYTKHTLKFGMNYRHYDLNDLSFQVLTHGRITIGNLADFVAGGGTSSSTYLQERFPTAPENLFKIWQVGFYAQDEYRATRNVRITLSLRADHDSNPVCKANCFARLDAPFNELSHNVNQPYNAVIQSNQANPYLNTNTLVWQPRLGLTWSPTKSGNTVISGGIGIFEQSLAGVTADAIARGNAPALNSFLVRNGKVSPGVPGNLFDIAAGANQSLVNAFNSGGTLASITASNPFFSAPGYVTTDRTFKTPRYYEWNLQIQQALPKQLVLSANYVGNHGIDEVFRNSGVNAYCDPTNCGGWPGLPTAPIDPRFTSVTQYMSGAVSSYDGLVLSIRRRFANGFSFGFNYTWSHSLDEVSNGGLESYSLATNASILDPENPFNIRAYNYGSSDYDVRHYINANYVWEDLVRHLSKKGPNVLLSGWNISGTIYHRSGLPFTVIDTNVSMAGFNYGLGSPFAQQVTAGPTTCGKASVDTPCFADSMFTDPTAFPAQTRNQFRGPGYFDTDFSVLKNFGIPKHETMKLTIGAQFYNLFNHPNFDQPINDVGAGSGVFGTITSTVTPPTSVYGAFVGSAVSGRIVQFRSQFTF